MRRCTSGARSSNASLRLAWRYCRFRSWFILRLLPKSRHSARFLGPQDASPRLEHLKSIHRTRLENPSQLFQESSSLQTPTENGSGLVVTVLRSDRPSLGIEAEYMAVINTNSEPLMNVETAAQYLCVHPKTLMKMAREHRVPAFRVGRYWLFRASLIDAWLQEQLEYGQANRAA